MEERTCLKCGKTKPLTLKYWHKNSKCKAGFAPRCKECRNEEQWTYRVKRDPNRDFWNTDPHLRYLKTDRPNPDRCCICRCSLEAMRSRCVQYGVSVRRLVVTETRFTGENFSEEDWYWCISCWERRLKGVSALETSFRGSTLAQLIDQHGIESKGDDGGRLESR